MVDIGAGLGDYSALAQMTVGSGVVHAYEPDPATFEMLEENLARNGARSVQTFAEAVGVVAGRYGPMGTGMHAVQTRFSPADDGAAPGVTLETVLDRLPGGRCDLVKIDCEGGEFELLLAASTDVLRRIDRIVVEVHASAAGETRPGLDDRLAAAGFVVHVEPTPAGGELSVLYAAREATC